MPTYRRTPLSAVTVLIALAALLVTAAFALARPARSATPADTAATTAPVKIMPLGDSITAGPGCWRAILWHDLQTNGYTNIDFVGSVPDGGCNYGYTYDGDNEGHGGYSATGIANQNQLPAWLSAANPDIVLMHLGTNDMWGGSIPVSSVLAAYTTLIGQMRANNPRMKILVAQIIPMNPPSCPTCAAEVQSLDQAIPGWAAGLTTAQSPIVVVDQWTGFDDATDTGGDGVHPNDTGFAKMAARWYPPLAQVLSGIIPPPPSPSASPSGSPSSSPSAVAVDFRFPVLVSRALRVHRGLSGDIPVGRRIPRHRHGDQQLARRFLGLDSHLHLRQRPAGHPIVEHHAQPKRCHGYREQRRVQRQPGGRRVYVVRLPRKLEWNQRGAVHQLHPFRLTGHQALHPRGRWPGAVSRPASGPDQIRSGLAPRSCTGRCSRR